MELLSASAGLFSAAAMIVLLAIIVVFYIRLTVEALRTAEEEPFESAHAQFNRTDASRRPGPGAIRRAVRPLPYRPASSAA
ncbi:hypothetical protein NCHU2750_29540 [Neorhizobium sp. NCHU2750]|nr:hypothetical protein NCHU2750_29540 [Neorhizobium sp. NCHU2750]